MRVCASATRRSLPALRPQQPRTFLSRDSPLELLTPAMELRVGNKYRLGRKIGSGSFGDIYLGTSVHQRLRPASDPLFSMCILILRCCLSLSLSLSLSLTHLLLPLRSLTD